MPAERLRIGHQGGARGSGQALTSHLVVGAAIVVVLRQTLADDEAEVLVHRDVAAIEHRNMLAEAKTFLMWYDVKKRWTTGNALADVEGIGKRRHGKPQLRIDEFRKFAKVALELAEKGDAGALCALMAGILGMRVSEIVGRKGQGPR